MNTLGIFAFYDKGKEVKGYVRFLIQQIKRELTDLVIVCNGEISQNGKDFFEKNAQKLIIRPNEGFDAGAYQDAILNHIGIQTIETYDSLLLFNNSFYGPIFPFEKMFQKMQMQELDFWGITAGGSEEKRTPYHIQSYFLMISKKITGSTCFKEYWETQDRCDTFWKAVYNFELRFTNYFLTRGYTCGTYIEREEIDRHHTISGNILSSLAFELLSEYQIPILKRKCTMLDAKGALYQNNADVLSYIDEHTDYDVDFIWEDILKEYTPYDLNARRFLRYIIPQHFNQNASNDDFIIIIYSVYYAEYLNFLKQFKTNINIILLVREAETDDALPGCERYVIEDEQQFWNVFRKILQDHRFCSEICLLSDSGQMQNLTGQKRTLTDICNKLLYSDHYTIGIQTLFQKNHRLGLLLPESECNFENLKYIGKKNRLSESGLKILSALQCSFDSIEGEKILENHGCFWCKPQIFAPLFAQGEDISFTKEEIITVLPYLAKKEGYFTALVNNAESMSKEYSIRCQIIDDVFEYLNFHTVYFNLAEGLSNIGRENVVDFACRHQGVYIFGAGFYGINCFHILKERNANIIGFVVTDPRGKTQMMNCELLCIDELRLKKNEALIVALSEKNQREVAEKLKKYPENQIYYL